MRRLCICAALIPSLLVATAPAQAASAKSHKQARGGSAHTKILPASGKRARTSHGIRVQKLTYGRT